jgi:hypothetical protein
MTTEELIQLLKDEKCYITEMSVEMNTDGVTTMNVNVTIVPHRAGIPGVLFMSKSRHEKIREHLPDELFEIE